MSKLGLKEIAGICGVSIATVSRVLSQDSSMKVKPETRRRILEAVGKFGYKPDFAARCLRSGKSRMIGVFGLDKLNLPIGVYEAILSGISSFSSDRGYELFIGLGPSTSVRLPPIQLDGAVVIHFSEEAKILSDIEESSLPYVAVNCVSGPKGISILPDDSSGTLKAMAHLHSLGHRKIAYAGLLPMHSATHCSVSLRCDSYCSFMLEHGLLPYPDFNKPLGSPAAFIESAVRKWGATAILAYDHFIALELLYEASSSGLKVPDSFSLMCFNDEFPVGRVHPGISAVAIPGEEMGSLAAELLIARMESPSPLPPERIVLDEALVLRGSTAPLK